MKTPYYTRDILIEELMYFYDKHGRSPKRREMGNNNGYPCLETFREVFGTWNQALEAAGLPINRIYKKSQR